MNKRKRGYLLISVMLGILIISSGYLINIEAGEVNYPRITENDVDVLNMEETQGKYVTILGKLYRNHPRTCDINGIIDTEGNLIHTWEKASCGSIYWSYQYKITGELGWSIYDGEYRLNIDIHSIERYSGN